MDSTIIENLHYLHMNGVYERIYNVSSDERKENELIEMGQTSPWILIPMLHQYFVPICKVFIESIGYKKLLDYPSNFKVCIIMCYFMCYKC